MTHFCKVMSLFGTIVTGCLVNALVHKSCIASPRLLIEFTIFRLKLFRSQKTTLMSYLVWTGVNLLLTGLLYSHKLIDPVYTKGWNK